ncbi:MAG: TolC family protein [Phycisphaerales bacterium]|nr:TolC family protein [Phycisphaerales bacterium]
MQKYFPHLTLVLFLVSGCSSPLDSPDAGPVLDKNLNQVIEREMQQVNGWETEVGTTPPPSAVEEALSHRMEELDAIVPVPPGSDLDFDLGINLNGDPQGQRPIELQACVRMALMNNLLLQSAQLQPAIQREQVIQAEAIFDIVLGAGYSYTRNRSPNQIVDVDGTLSDFNVDPGTTNIRTNDAEVSLSKKLTSGGSAKLSTDLVRSNVRGSDDITYAPNPYWQPSLTLDYSQPILRGFGEKVNLAQVYIARKLEQEAIESLRQSLINTVANTEVAYWQLAYAWRALGIQLWLIDAAEELRDLIDLRRNYDASLADWAQAVSTVEQRIADVISFQQSVKEASDNLKVLLNDPGYPLAGESVLAPVNEMVHTPISLDLRSALLTAVSMRPDIRQSIYQIDITRIEEVVADNARLPELDLQAQVSTTGMGADADKGYDAMVGGDFISYVLGLTFEYPLGNRAAEAAWRESRLERSSAMVNYRTAIQTAILDVKTTMREVIDNAQYINATRVARLATAEYLRALEVERETLASLTPTFLNLIFSAQASLATARSDEFEALSAFNISVVNLHRAMGTILDMHRIGLEQVDEDSYWGPVVDSPTQ